MSTPKQADNKPLIVDLEAGKTYAWCACGLSANQPWCDGSHKPTGLAPKVFKAEESKKAAMCMCKATGNPAFCDGTHSRL